MYIGLLLFTNKQWQATHVHKFDHTRIKPQITEVNKTGRLARLTEIDKFQ